MKFKKPIQYGLFCGILAFSLLCGCASSEADKHLKDSTLITDDLKSAAENLTPQQNPCGDLSVPTYINKIDDTYFIVDCYHNQVIYNDNLDSPLYEWTVMTNDLAMAHTIVSDGVVYLIDDTENHRVVVFEKYDDKFVHTQTFENMGTRPHYIQYREKNKTFYVWSSMTGEMFLLRRNEADNRMYLSDIKKIDSLDGIYVRSFTIIDEDIYFVSGNSSIIKARLKDFKIEKEYPVPSELAGMIQLTKIEDMYYITISTDALGNQDYATFIRTEKLENLQEGKWEDIYENFVGGGTPYYISTFDNTYYLTEHRIPGHSIWSFDVEQNELKNITAIY